jgi:hypothetical protein
MTDERPLGNLDGRNTRYSHPGPILGVNGHWGIRIAVTPRHAATESFLPKRCDGTDAANTDCQ